MKLSRLAIVGLLCLPFLVVVATHFPAPAWSDAIMYDRIVRDFLKTGLFRCAIFSEIDPIYLQANFDNGPMYSVLHLIIFKLFGSTDHRLIVGLNYLLVLLSTYNIAKVLQLKGREKFLLCLITFNPLVVHSANLIRPEWLNVYWLSWIWRLFACNYRSLFKPLFCLLIGFFLALAAQTHYFSIFFIPFIIYECWISEKSLWPRIRTALGIMAATAVFLIPYAWYLLNHLDAFTVQVLMNQFGTNASHSTLKFLQHMLQPLFFPSSTIYTESQVIPRWLPVVFHLSLVAAVVGFTIKWKRHIPFSATTRQAIVLWGCVALGTAMVSYTPYMIFYFAVVGVAVWRDLVPHLHWNFRAILLGMIAASLTYSVFFDHYVSRTVFNWPDYSISVQCLAKNIPQNETVYILAYPDPSVALSNMRPDLDIRRYSDFARYTAAWERIVKKQKSFIISGDQKFFQRFDHGGALHAAISTRPITQHECHNGPIHYVYLVKN